MTTIARRQLSSPPIRFGELPSTITFRIREPGSALTHFAAFIGVIAGAGPLLLEAREHAGRAAEAYVAVFLLSALLLYAASTVYHTVVLPEKPTRVFKKLDHSMISVLIAGTYTPVCLLALPGPTGTALLAAVWAMAVLGIGFKLFWVTCPRWVSSVLYLAMGWVCLFAMVPLIHALTPAGLFWLVLGGLLYSAGAVIYALRRPAFDARHPYFGTHEIFHCFIMAGTLAHYVFMFHLL